MTGHSDTGRPRTGRAPTTLAAVGLALGVAVILVLVGTPGASAPKPSATWPPSPLEWNNGLVLCSFNPTNPSVSVSALNLSASGLSSGLSSVAEVNPVDATVAVASVDSAAWTVVNASTNETFDLAYQAHLTLLPPGGPSTSLGSTDVRVDYTLAAYEDSTLGNLSSVAAVFQVSHWTWQSLGDRLVLTLPLWPTFAQSEHLSAQAPNGLGITSWSNATGAPREYFQLSGSATATPAGGAPESVSVSPVLSVSPSSATVGITVGSGAGNFTSMTYTAHVSLPLPSTLAGLPLYDYALVAGAAAVLSIVVAVGTRRVRQRPSDLQYVEEEP